METAIAIRDGIFWWVGNWAIFTALDAALWMGWRDFQAWREDRAEREWEAALDREEREDAARIEAEYEAHGVNIGPDHQKE